MTDKTERLSVELNEAFARMEQEQDSPDSQKRSVENNPEKAKRRKNIKQPTGSGVGNILGVLTGLIAIGIASYSAFQSYQVGNNQRDQAAANSDFNQQIEVLRQEVGASFQASVSVRNQLEALSGIQESSTQQLEEKLDRSLADLRRDIGTSSEDWLLAEVEYLVRLGGQRVVMEGDPLGSIAFFEAADVIVRDALGLSAFDLRKALAKDIASLKRVSDLDVDGLFVKLAALIDQVDQLKQHKLEFKEVELSIPVVESSSTVERLIALATSAFVRVTALVDYRNGSAVSPILPPLEESFLRQNLVMQLQMAQLGLLRSDQQVFVASLSETEEWIIRHFDLEESTAIEMIKVLNEMKGIDVARAMPDVSGSSREVRKLLARFHQKTDREATSPTPEALVIDQSGTETSEPVPSQAARPETESGDQQGASLPPSDQLGEGQSGVKQSAAEQTAEERSGAEQ
jgi:uroporphyrin-3 C-methyltransferase